MSSHQSTAIVSIKISVVVTAILAITLAFKFRELERKTETLEALTAQLKGVTK